MLVITRSENQETYIGDDVKVVVLSINGHQVRLGIQAPPNMKIERDNIKNRQKKEY